MQLPSKDSSLHLGGLGRGIEAELRDEPLAQPAKGGKSARAVTRGGKGSRQQEMGRLPEGLPGNGALCQRDRLSGGADLQGCG